MATAYQVQHIATKPAGWKVRSKRSGTHLLRIAFPPGRRRKGAGRLLEILHPKKNPSCPASCDVARKNPTELLIFGNPSKKRNAGGGFGNHRPGCPCAFCKRAAALQAGTASPPKRSRKNRRKRNQGETPETEASVRLFQKFHGRDPKEIMQEQVNATMRMDYTSLGMLLALGLDDEGYRGGDRLAHHWKDCPHIEFDQDVKLASATNGKQLYLIGGDQNMDRALAEWDGVDASKDLIDLGDCYFVTYLARKSQDGGQPTEYTHRFGEDGGTLPRIVYNKLQKQVFLAGGEYFIDTRGATSPGIEN